MSWRRNAFVVLTCLLATQARAGVLPDVLPTGGINLADYNYYDIGVPFIDYAKMSNEWLSSDGRVWSDERPIALTSQGYPASLCKTKSLAR